MNVDILLSVFESEFYNPREIQGNQINEENEIMDYWLPHVLGFNQKTSSLLINPELKNYRFVWGYVVFPKAKTLN
jgi:hypothetical protein